MSKSTATAAKPAVDKDAPKTENALTTAQGGEVAAGGTGTAVGEVLGSPSVEDGMEAMAGKGLENVTAKDIFIPRLTILQALSPQLVKTKPEYMPQAKVGDFCDVGLQELMDSPLGFVPVYFIVQYLEWRPNRKGLAGIHEGPSILEHCKPDEQRRPVLPNGNFISETAQFYGLNLNAQMRKSFIPMASTQLKKGRRWNTLATSEKVKRRDNTEFTPPLFYRSYILTTVPESNEQGNWDGWKIERGPKIADLAGEEAKKVFGENSDLDPKKVFDTAVELYESIVAGRARADLESMASEAEQNQGNNGAM